MNGRQVVLRRFLGALAIAGACAAWPIAAGYAACPERPA
jgi:hypothetical protein